MPCLERGLAIMFHSYVRLFCFSRVEIVKGRGGQTLVANKLAATGILESAQLELSLNVLSAV